MFLPESRTIVPENYGAIWGLVMEKTDFKEIGLNIHNLRRRAGLHQGELANLVGVSSQYISQVERAKKQINLDVLVRIANALNVDINSILGCNVKVKNLALDENMAELMAVATPDQKRLCVKLCELVVYYSNDVLRNDWRRR